MSHPEAREEGALVKGSQWLSISEITPALQPNSMCAQNWPFQMFLDMVGTVH